MKGSNCNVGTLDSVLRIVLGTAVVLLVLIGSFSMAVVIGGLAVGAILIGTGAFSTCPIYRLFGLSTCRPREQH